MDHAILVGKEVVTTDMMTWALWFQDIQQRRVAETMVGPVRVSTVFLGLNHNYGGRRSCGSKP